MADYPFHVRDVHISDPFILADPVTHLYYLYARNFSPERFPDQKDKGCFHALVSPDLVHWSEPIQVFDQESCGFWADLDYWAPECHLWRGKYYLISSFRAAGTLRRCQCLIADSPLGPFKPIEPDPVTPNGWQCLDGTLYEDRHGKPWLVFCHEWLQVFDGQVAAIPLSDDLGHAIGKPEILFRASDAPWRASQSGNNGSAGFVTDGPFLHRMADGTLIMLWSNFTDNGYATGYAVSLSGDVMGPWSQEQEPLYALDGAHSMLFRTFEGQLMMALHCPNVHPKKRMLLFEMEEKQGKLHILNEVTGNWYNNLGGRYAQYVYKDPLQQEPVFRKDW